MDASLSRLLQQLYGSGQPLGPSTPVPEDGRPGQLSTDDFRMFVYKVMPCTRRGPHSWVECAFCHPGEKAARRCPQKHAYMPLACPNLKRDGRCPQGDSCHFAHSLFEYWLHPARYRTQLCSYGVECKRSICFFAHHAGELRITEHTAQLLALEKELESADPSYASSNAKWGINSTPPSPHNRNNGGVRQVGEGRNGGRGVRGAGAQGHGPRQQGQQPLAGQLGMGLGLGEGLDGQLAQLRHLQALQQQQQQQGAGRAGQGFMGALGPDMDPFTFPGRQEQGAGAGAFGNQASGAALLEAALQQRSAAAAAAAAAMHADGYGGAAPPRQHQHPQYADGSAAPQADAARQQHQMAAAMRMLLNLSLGPNTCAAAGAGAPGGAYGASGQVDRLQTYGSLPAGAFTQPPPPPPPQQHQQLQAQGSDTQQAMQLIAQLQQLAARGGVQAAPGAPASPALQSLLLSGGLPHLLSQFGGTGPAAHTQATALAQQMHQVQMQMQMQQQQQAMLMQQQQQQQQQQAMRGMPQLGSVASMPPSYGAPLPAPARPFDEAAASAALFGGPSAAVKCPPSKPNSSGSPSPANALSVRTRHTAGSSVSSGASDGTRSPPLSHHSDEGVWAVREGDQWGFRRASLGSDATIAQPIRTSPGQPNKPAPPAPAAAAASELGPFSSMAAYRALGDSAAPAPAAGGARVRLPHSLDDGELGLASGMADMAGASAMIASLSQLVDGPSSL